VSELIPDRLRRRVRSGGGGEPLLTYYEPAAGARTELSAVTLLNWVDKTSHLLDELDVAAGDVVGLPLALVAPGHWVTAVWELACWQVGTAVAVGVESDARLLVTGPDWSAYPGSAVDVVACSLHPLGLPLAERPPSSVLDYAAEVRGQADVHAPVPLSAGVPAWVDTVRRLTQGDLAAAASGRPPGRRLVRPGTPWSTACAAVLEPLVAGGSAVVVAGPVEEEQLARIRREERVDG